MISYVHRFSSGPSSLVAAERAKSALGGSQRLPGVSERAESPQNADSAGTGGTLGHLEDVELRCPLDVQCERLQAHGQLDSRLASNAEVAQTVPALEFLIGRLDAAAFLVSFFESRRLLLGLPDLGGDAGRSAAKLPLAVGKHSGRAARGQRTASAMLGREGRYHLVARQMLVFWGVAFRTLTNLVIRRVVGESRKVDGGVLDICWP